MHYIIELISDGNTTVLDVDRAAFYFNSIKVRLEPEE